MRGFLPPAGDAEYFLSGGGDPWEMAAFRYPIRAILTLENCVFIQEDLMPRASVFAFLVSTLLGLSPYTAFAQGYPSQSIKIIVPTAPGGVADIVGRILAQRLSEIGKTAVVENRTGAGGIAAADFAAKSAADGHTIYVGFLPTQVILPHLQKLPYDADKDFVPITIAVKSANVIVVHPSVPALSMNELVNYAKANPKKLSYSSQGHGSSGHIVGEQFKRIAGIDLAHVPYRGAAPAVQDVIAGHISMTFVSPALAVTHVKSGALRALAISSANRDTLFPGVPTTAEAGWPGLDGWGPWFGFFVPAKTPRDVIGWLHAEITNAFSTPENRARFTEQGLTTVLDTPDATAAFVASESKLWKEAITQAGIQAEPQ